MEEFSNKMKDYHYKLKEIRDNINKNESKLIVLPSLSIIDSVDRILKVKFKSIKV